MRNFYCVQMIVLYDNSIHYTVCHSYTDAWDELRRNELELDDNDFEFHVVDLSSDEIQSQIDKDEDSVSFQYPLSQELLWDE